VGASIAFQRTLQSLMLDAIWTTMFAC